ncbi:hypothetical protein ACOMHN_019198 [Nucella lapillus]
MHSKAHLSHHVKRRTKVSGQYRAVHVCQPKLVNSYNQNMAGVDKSDQLIGRYETLRKVNRRWKTLFYHFLDVARVNSYLLFKDWMEKHPDIPELQRPKAFNQMDFTVELIKHLANITEDSRIYNILCIPLSLRPPTPSSDHPVMPAWNNDYKNCKKCYTEEKVERKTCHLCYIQETFLLQEGEELSLRVTPVKEGELSCAA